MNNEEFKGWVTETCVECGKAFMFNDMFGQINDEPIGKFYCPTCFNKKEITPDIFLKNNFVNDKIIKAQFKKLVKRNKGLDISYKEMLKQAIEISGYIKEEQENR